ncbi:MAG: sulfatase-like hydrolase/transferase [Candidatus Omnitrophica bacterium]|nr:sulfatase-like hydrolase/transferase [Candidatus Omnitrophota bacterium]
MKPINKPIVILAGAAVAAVCLAALFFVFGNGGARKERPNVLFIIVDTLRADHLGCYGYKKIKTPNIDGLASRGTRFKNVISQVPLTFPSHVGIFTSTYPNYNKMRDNGSFRLEDDAVTLAQVFKQHGYATAAFVSTIVLDKKYGLNRGFDTYDDKMEKLKDKQILKFMDEERPADKVTEAAQKWLAANKDKSFFLWVHYYDPHTIYNPPAPYNEIYKDNLYDGEIAFTDEHIGKLLATLKELGLDKNTLIVFTSDHGESLGEHSEIGHAIFLYDSTLKVPLIFSYPKLIPEGKVIETQVRLVDLAPTIMDLLGLKKKGVIQGRSLAGIIKGSGKAPDLPAYSESLYAKYHYNWDELHSWRDGKWKYIRSSEPELYDIVNDPHELKNLAGERLDVAKKMAAELENFLKKTSSAKKEKKIEVDRQTREKLASLGYIQGTVVTATEGANPRKMIQTMERMNLLARLANSGKIDEAIAGFKEVLKADPNNIEANRHIAQLYKEIGNYDDAIRHFRKAASFKPDDPETHNGLGNVYKNMGRVKEAFDEFSIAAVLDPEDGAVVNNIGWCYQQKGDFNKALEYYEKAVKLDPNIAMAHANMAVIYRVRKDLDRAAEKARKAIDLDPTVALAYSELGAIAATKGDLDKAVKFCEKAVELDPNWPDGHYNLGVTYEWKGDYAKALENYLNALKLASWNPNFHFSAATTYYKLGQLDKAAEEAQKALKIAPNFKRANTLLDMIDKEKNNEPSKRAGK